MKVKGSSVSNTAPSALRSANVVIGGDGGGDDDGDGVDGDVCSGLGC